MPYSDLGKREWGEAILVVIKSDTFFYTND